MDEGSSRLSDADAMLWALDRDPPLRSPITAVAVLDREPDFDAVLERFRTLCRLHLHFRSIVASSCLPWRQPQWRECPGFDPADHLHHVRVALPGDVRQVLDLAQGMALLSFDPARPPWDAFLVDGMVGGRAALIIRIHHAVIDGVGGLLVAASMMDRDTTGTPLLPDSPAGSGPNGSGGPDRASSGRSPVDTVLRVPRQLATTAWNTSAHPLQTVERWRETTADAAHLVSPAPRPLSPLLRDRSLGRRFETVDVPSDALRAVEGSPTTLNHVFVSSLLRGLALYHGRHGSRAAHLRVVMPVSTRRPSDPMESNRFVPVRVVLPADLPEPADYLHQVPALLDKWKHSEALGVSDLLTTALRRLPAPLAVGALSAMLTGVDLVATNVPGPPEEAYLAGARLESLYAFAPTAGAALNAALVTTAGSPTIGLTIDTAAIGDPDVLVGCLRQGLAEVLGALTSSGGDAR